MIFWPPNNNHFRIGKEEDEEEVEKTRKKWRNSEKEYVKMTLNKKYQTVKKTVSMSLDCYCAVCTN